MMGCKAGDVVIAPFPFMEKARAKPRPLLIISAASFNETHEKVIALMITTAMKTSWPSDISIQNILMCGLTHASSVRMKCFTLDTCFITKYIGAMSKSDWSRVQRQLKNLLAL